MMSSTGWDAFPQEIFENIALFAATDHFLGPPAALVPLLCTCRTLNAYLSMTTNLHLYAQIFACKFDTASSGRRFGAHVMVPAWYASELRRRCVYLKRMRTRLDAVIVPESSSTAAVSEESENERRSTLWMAYLMMLENDGKNERQLREYAGIAGWLRLYWFDEHGASLVKHSIQQDCWPPNTQEMALAMWLFWFLLRVGEYGQNQLMLWDMTSVLKVLALSAHKYDLSSPSWKEFIPAPVQARQPQYVTHYSMSLQLRPPPLAIPSILSFLSLNTLPSEPSPWFGSAYLSRMLALPLQATSGDSQEWECEWERSRNLGQDHFGNILTKSFRPGSIEGLWEGIFTYTEFSVYGDLLSGASPISLLNCLAAQHWQTWKLREYHLLAPDPSLSEAGTLNPLSPGICLRSYFPVGSTLHEDSTGVYVRDPIREETIHYQKADVHGNDNMATDQAPVLDIIIIGEGHSAWGQFSLRGRVRPCDGFISLTKEYTSGDRGTWLYRGYLIGNVDGHLCGRWRDTVSGADVAGYEGCFTMSRRR